MTSTTITRKDLTKTMVGYEVTVGDTEYVVGFVTDPGTPGRYDLARRFAGSQEPVDLFATLADVIARLNEIAEVDG